MARLPRLVLPGCAHHLIQRGHNRDTIFLSDADRAAYLSFLRDAARAERVAVHAYVLMDNHVHLLVTPENDTGLSRMMQSLGRRYVGWFNHAHARSGTLWEGRFRGTIIDSEHYLMACMRYIDLNPVRAGIVAAPEAYAWSSFGHHVGQRRDPLITEHALYWGLGNTPFEREAAYRAFVAQGTGEHERETISLAALKGWALGSKTFLDAAADATRRPLAARPRGRPSGHGKAD
jgi:putative transposase